MRIRTPNPPKQSERYREDTAIDNPVECNCTLLGPSVGTHHIRTVKDLELHTRWKEKKREDAVKKKAERSKLLLLLEQNDQLPRNTTKDAEEIRQTRSTPPKESDLEIELAAFTLKDQQGYDMGNRGHPDSWQTPNRTPMKRRAPTPRDESDTAEIGHEYRDEQQSLAERKKGCKVPSIPTLVGQPSANSEGSEDRERRKVSMAGSRRGEREMDVYEPKGKSNIIPHQYLNFNNRDDFVLI